MSPPPWEVQRSRPSLTREGPRLDEIQIIGVELAVSIQGREHELDMFACRHTLPADPVYGYSEVRITLHTNRGDRTIRQQVQLF